MMTNTGCKQLFAGEDLGEACANCRFYDESRGRDQAMCRKWKIKTVVAASCRQYEKKVDSHEA